MPIRELDESEIINKIKELIKNNDLHSEVVKQYFQEIYQRYYFQSYNISRYYGLQKQDAEDAVQESFIKLFRSIKSYDPNRPFKPWFFKIVMNAVRDKYRDIYKHKYTEIEYVKTKKSTDQEFIFDEFHMREVLQGIIIRLPKKLKSVVILRNYTDMNLESISNSVGLSVRQLQNRLSQAYMIMRKELGDHNG